MEDNLKQKSDRRQLQKNKNKNIKHKMEDDLKKQMGENLKKMKNDLNKNGFKFRGKPFLGLDPLSKIFR
jgi:hypothetical protein